MIQSDGVCVEGVETDELASMLTPHADATLGTPVMRDDEDDQFEDDDDDFDWEDDDDGDDDEDYDDDDLDYDDDDDEMFFDDEEEDY